MKNIKENTIIIIGLLLISCFVTGFSTTFSFLGRASNISATIIVLVGLNFLIKHESKMTKYIENLEQENRKLQEKLEDTEEEIRYWKDKKRAGEV